MKRLLRHFLSYGISIYLASLIIPGVHLSGDLLHTLGLVSLVLMLLHTFIKPILDLFLLPLNILTLGLLKKAIDIVLIYATTIIIPQFAIESFYFNGLTVGPYDLPAMQVNKILAIIVVAVFVGIVGKILAWVLD